MQAYLLHLLVSAPLKSLALLSADSYQGVTRQTSSLSQPSNNSVSPGLNGQQPAAMKVKIYFGDDLIAILVPTDVNYEQLHEKIRERLKIPQGEEIALRYRDESTGDTPPMISDNDLDLALQRNDKLIIYADYN